MVRRIVISKQLYHVSDIRFNLKLCKRLAQARNLQKNLFGFLVELTLVWNAVAMTLLLFLPSDHDTRLGWMNGCFTR